VQARWVMGVLYR